MRNHVARYCEIWGKLRSVAQHIAKHAQTHSKIVGLDALGEKILVVGELCVTLRVLGFLVLVVVPVLVDVGRCM